jgi:1,4-dihydroxy-2-naphthoate octaprenyltransferase
VRRLLAFVRLSRPLFLGGGFAGVALGAAVAAWEGHAIDAATYGWAQLQVTTLHLMVHYGNDYFDRECDRGVVRTAWSGGSGVLPGAGLPPRVALIAALVCAAFGAAAALRFALAGNRVVALLGLAILVGGWIYSAPPLRLAARGLGEIDAALVVAAFVPAVGYAAFAGAPDARFLDVLVPCVCALFAMMLCVEIPDAGFDAAAGKRNLVVRWGPSMAYNALTVPLVAALLSLASVTFGRGLPPLALLAAVPALAVGAALAWRIWRGDRRPATIAFLGVALYGTTASGLAAAYALAAR